MSAQAIQNSLSRQAEDPRVQSVARVYAVGLLDAAARDGAVDGVLEELGSLVDDVLSPNPDFEQLLCTGLTTQEDKLRLIEKVLASRGSPLLVNLLNVLAKHERLDVLRAVRAVAVREQEQRQGRVRVKVTSAAALSDSAVESLRQQLSQALSADPILEPVVDPQLLGGLVIRIGDTVYDGSVRNRLRQLRGKLRQRCLNEVQRGRDRFSHPAGN
jgi:F-type H+-transporting ATPase subunit delta